MSKLLFYNSLKLYNKYIYIFFEILWSYYTTDEIKRFKKKKIMIKN